MSVETSKTEMHRKKKQEKKIKHKTKEKQNKQEQELLHNLKIYNVHIIGIVEEESGYTRKYFK